MKSAGPYLDCIMRRMRSAIRKVDPSQRCVFRAKSPSNNPTISSAYVPHFDMIASSRLLKKRVLHHWILSPPSGGVSLL